MESYHAYACYRSTVASNNNNKGMGAIVLDQRHRRPTGRYRYRSNNVPSTCRVVHLFCAVEVNDVTSKFVLQYVPVLPVPLYSATVSIHSFVGRNARDLKTVAE